ncbi:MAG: class I SAM-dependent methyltransferase, partial [Thermodesulfobacteriota bacterium]
ESIRKFPDQETFKGMMEEAGLFKVRYHNLFNGIAAVHIGIKV